MQWRMSLESYVEVNNFLSSRSLYVTDGNLWSWESHKYAEGKKYFWIKNACGFANNMGESHVNKNYLCVSSDEKRFVIDKCSLRKKGYLYAWKTIKCTNYLFNLLIMYGSSYTFRHYIAFSRELC
jgi:hypothetical protein